MHSSLILCSFFLSQQYVSLINIERLVRDSHESPSSNQTTTIEDDREPKKRMENMVGSAKQVNASRPSIQISYQHQQHRPRFMSFGQKNFHRNITI